VSTVACALTRNLLTWLQPFRDLNTLMTVTIKTLAACLAALLIGMTAASAAPLKVTERNYGEEAALRDRVRLSAGGCSGDRSDD
jgi:hypothetical protein